MPKALLKARPTEIKLLRAFSSQALKSPQPLWTPVTHSSCFHEIHFLPSAWKFLCSKSCPWPLVLSLCAPITSALPFMSLPRSPCSSRSPARRAGHAASVGSVPSEVGTQGGDSRHPGPSAQRTGSCCAQVGWSPLAGQCSRLMLQGEGVLCPRGSWYSKG